MAVPTITEVRPRRGAADGFTLVEIDGTNFNIPVVPAATPTVRVTVGGRWARNVLVYSAEHLVCITPKGDPFTAAITATASAVADTFTAVGHTLREGDRVMLAGTSTPAPLLAADAQDAVPLYAKNVVAGVSFQVSYTVGGSAVDITADGACIVESDGYQAVVVENLDANGAPIGGESATFPLGFQFVRPDLTHMGHLAWTLLQFTRDMRRLCPTVAWSTHSDYDEETGDMLNITQVAKLPALILSELRFPEDRQRPFDNRQSFAVGEERYRELRAPIIMDIRFLLTGVSDNSIEMLSLLEVVRAHFKKACKLEVPRDGTGADPNDMIVYDQHIKFVDVTTTLQQEGTPLQSFSAEVEILGVVSTVMPGAPEETLVGLAADGLHEATTAFGYTLDRAVVGVAPK